MATIKKALYQFNDARLPLVDDDYIYFSQDDQNPKNRRAKLLDYKAYFSLQADLEIEIPVGLTVAQMQVLVDAVPKFLNDNTLIFTFKSGTHNFNDTLYFKSFTGGNLIIRGEPSILQSTIANLKLIDFESCSSITTITALEFKSNTIYTTPGEIILVNNLSKLTISQITINDTNFSNFAWILIRTCNVIVETSDFNLMQRAIYAFSGSVVVVDSNNNFGTLLGANTNDITAYSSIVIYTGDVIADGVIRAKFFGGQISDQTGWL